MCVRPLTSQPHFHPPSPTARQQQKEGQKLRLLRSKKMGACPRWREDTATQGISLWLCDVGHCLSLCLLIVRVSGEVLISHICTTHRARGSSETNEASTGELGSCPSCWHAILGSPPIRAERRFPGSTGRAAWGGAALRSGCSLGSRYQSLSLLSVRVWGK